MKSCPQSGQVCLNEESVAKEIVCVRACSLCQEWGKGRCLLSDGAGKGVGCCHASWCEGWEHYLGCSSLVVLKITFGNSISSGVGF